MKHSMRTFACGFVLAVGLFAAGCGGTESVASRSAAAYRDAEAKGISVGGGHEHGGHEVESASVTPDEMSPGADPAAADPHEGQDSNSSGTAMDHREHGGMITPADHAAMGHDTSIAAHAADGTRRAVTDHAAMGHGTSTGEHAQQGAAAETKSRDAHAGMQHGTTTAAADPHAQHQPRPMAEGDHARHGTAPSETQQKPTVPHHLATVAAPQTADVPNTRAEMTAVSPAETLQIDPFDAPVPVSVAEAAKAAAGMSHVGPDTVHTVPGSDQANPPARAPAGHEHHADPAPPAQQRRPGGAEESSVVYTCPMHPEVTSTTPGTCPVCGMALVVEEPMKEKQ